MRNKEQITTIMKGGCSKSGTWKYFDQHLVNGVKYGRCKDETCPGKSQKNRRKTECDVGGEKKKIIAPQKRMQSQMMGNLLLKQ